MPMNLLPTSLADSYRSARKKSRNAIIYRPAAITARFPSCSGPILFGGGLRLRHRVGDAGQLVILVLLAQRDLEQLAGRGVGKAVDEQDFVGQPPFGDVGAQMRLYLVRAHLAAGLAHDEE